MRLLPLLILGLLLCPAYCQCQQSNPKLSLSDRTLLKCVIGEASGEGLQGMQAVAEAIRNRGSIKGVYGCKARHVDQESINVHNAAKLAIKRSKTSNLVRGADHWENIDAFGKPYWAKSMIKTAQIVNHAFYKSPSKPSKKTKSTK